MNTQPVWRNGYMFVYELSSCGFESSCSHLNFKFRACVEQGVPWKHSSNNKVWIHSETRTWHEKNRQSNRFKERHFVLTKSDQHYVCVGIHFVDILKCELPTAHYFYPNNILIKITSSQENCRICFTVKIWALSVECQ